MSEQRITDEEIARLSTLWKSRLDDAVTESPASPDEFRRDAAQFRALAAASSFEGQRRAFIGAAERYEREASQRSAVQP